MNPALLLLAMAIAVIFLLRNVLATKQF